ncbi:unnamed protein product [Allacma fusca]|uniref:Gamma-interferon-inducible lysosomal thiol reductase n=1 Tax=Allacma fusca TaxID=39272 RepID=A0A8J2JVL6_9HEXA|nr:unnamed protein product [Allacma fusca]
MRIILSVFLLVLSASQGLGAEETPRTKISVYYESLCGDSRRFIKNQLYPLMRSPIGKYVDLELVPYGKATTSGSNGNYEFSCQHGEPECLGNRVHSCALSKLTKSQALDFVHCSMASSYPPEAGQECSNQLNLDFDPIKTCSTSKDGDELLATNGRKTHGLSPKLYFVPWIVFDGKWSEELMERSLQNLRTVVCEKIGEDLCSETTENRGSRRVRRRITTLNRRRRIHK